MKSLIPILLLAVATPSITPIYAQNPPARTYQPGFWQPIARFNTQQPVSVNITNKTDIPIEYDLTDLESMNPTAIEPNQTGTLQGFGDKANIVIYPLVESYADFTLHFEITVDENTNDINVSVTKDKPTFFGHRSVNLQNTGAIFIY